jgi:hypothetical protein
MFSSFTTRLRTEVETIKLVLDTHESLRNIVFPQEGSAGQENGAAQNEVRDVEAPTDERITQIRQSAPPRPAWQVYDHCAAFTRLYAVYEAFVEDLVSDYLRILPEIYSRYEELPASVTTQHRVGIGQILLKLGKDGPYKELAERDIVQGLSHGLSGNPNYSLLRDAFLIDPQNYRAETVAKVFSYLGFEDCWSWVEKHPLMKAFMQDRRDVNETPKTLLHDFVSYRNKASHTVVGDIVSIEEIKSISDFVVVLSETLAQLVMRQVVRRKAALSQAIAVGLVIHRFSERIVGARMSAGSLAAGDDLAIVQKHGCFKATVLSIRVGQNPYERIELEDGQEIGIRLSERVNEGAELMRLPSAQPPGPTELLPEPISPDDYPIEQEPKVIEQEPKVDDGG